MLASKLKKAACSAVGAALLLGPGIALADFPTALQEPVTEVAHVLVNLHNIMLVIIWIVGLIVFGGTGYAILKFRKSKGAKSASFHENLPLEIAWTVIPFLVLIGIGFPATKALILMADTSNADITIKATGYQWKWKYDYLGEEISFVSSLSTPKEQIYGDEPKSESYLLEVDNPVVVPINKKIRFLATSNDVNHAWYVPELGVKKDAVAGFIGETWATVEKVGTYRGQCAELCGKGHGFMPIVVKAVTQEQYTQWVAEQKAAKKAQAAASGKTWSRDDLMAKGKSVYDENCLMCHGESGEGNTDLQAPAITGSKIAVGPADEHIKLVMFGVEGTAMAAYKELLNDVDIAAVITYERNSLGNNTGDVVQPATINAAR